MRLKAFKKLGDTHPIDQEVAVVLIEGEHGQPVAVACDLGQGAIHTSHAGDEDFNRVLMTLGFDKLVVTEVLDQKEPMHPNSMPQVLQGLPT